MAVLGTAGHVDHGKTTLVRALTGVDTDRLPEEKRRGITIELGFAPLRVRDPDGAERTVAIVDVPGHERFVGTMAAGAQGVDVALLVVAADAGVMPQTREHLTVLEALGVRALLVALTRCDVADEETRALARIDVEDAVSRTPWPRAPIHEVSGRTGAGVDALRDAIAAATRALDLGARRAQPARLAVDRVFVPRGQGVVVTGTLVSGSVAVGDELEIAPGGRRVRVRSLHAHGSALTRAAATGRVALGLAGVELADVRRGEVLVAPGTIASTRAFDAAFVRRPGGRPMGRRARVAVHLGTDEIPGRLVPIAPLAASADPARGASAPKTTIAGGEAWLVRVVLARAAPVAVADRGVVRGDAPLAAVGTTLGALEVVRAIPGKLAGGRARYAELLRRLRESDTQARARLEVEASGLAGLAESELGVRLRTRGVPRDVARSLPSLPVGGSARLVSEAAASKARSIVLAAVDRWHEARPDDEGAPLAVVLGAAPQNAAPGLAERALERAIGDGSLVRVGERVRRAGFAPRARVDDPSAVELSRRLREGGLAPPSLSEVAKAIGLEATRARALATILAANGAIVHVQGDLWFDRGALDALRARLVAFLEARGAISTAEFKDLVGASRKFVVPLAEWFDGQKVTLRVGEVRKLRR